MRPTNSSSRLSPDSPSTEPSVDMASDSVRSSSSSSSFHTFSPWLSPSASISTAARSGPLRARPTPFSAWRLANVATRSAISLCDLVLAMAVSGVLQPLSDHRDGLLRIALGELAHLLHRLGVDLALDL